MIFGSVKNQFEKTTALLSGGMRLFALAMLLWLASAGAVSAAVLNEPMTGATAPGWVIGGSAYLTGSTGADAPGNGWLRLTEPTNDQAGFAMLDSSFDISQGVVIQFDYATWGGTGADGYSIYLFDALYDVSTFQPGASGGSLGYDKKTVAPVHAGLTGGYIGVGIDEYGNFSNPSEGRSGGPGLLANSVAVRGPYDHPTAPYYYLGGTASLPTPAQSLAFNGQAFRPGQTGTQYRKVVIYLTPVAAPNYLRVDAYVQFGYNQPLTQLVTGLYTGRPIPSSVKVGYAASTGGSTNYHEIRNLTIDPLPTDVNLAIAKTVSSPTVAPGGALTYTVTARNYGPSLTTATNVPITDTMPAQLTGVTWTCTGSGGATCGAASGSGNLNTTATLPFNGAATYTISGAVSAATPLGTVISNTATLTPPAWITDYTTNDNSATVTTTVSNSNITISGTVYNDNGTGGGTAHDGVLNGSEASVTGVGSNYYAKIFRSNDLTTTIATPVQVNATTGAYSFSGIPGYGTYTIILSSTNTANVYDPSFPNTNWIYVAPVNFTMGPVSASGSNLTNKNFFLYNGSRITGKVIKDDGYNGSISTAYDGILNAAETGISGVTLTLRNDAATTTYDTSITDSGGNFTLYANPAVTGTNVSLRIYETNPVGYTSVSSYAGTTAGAYTINGEYIRFTYTRYTDYSGVLFGDVPTITATFTPTPLSASGTPAAPVYYAHQFTATGRGSVGFAVNSRSQGSWPAVSYILDGNCNGSFDTGEPDITAAITTAAGVPVCILVRETIPAGATPGTTDQVVTRATFTYGPANLTSDVTDTTTVANYPNLVTSTKTWVDQNGGGQYVGDVIQYTITLRESNGLTAGNVSLSDTISSRFTGFAMVSTGLTYTYSAGVLNVTNLTVPANGSISIVYNVTIGPGNIAGDTIDNTAAITLTGYPPLNAVATTITISGSVTGTGTKTLYLYDGASSPAYKLSRTVNSSTTGFATINTTTPQTWAMNPVTASAITIDPAVSSTVPVTLNMRRNATTGSRTIKVDLQCSSLATVLTLSRAINMNGTQTAYIFNLPIASAMTCPRGSSWNLTVSQTSGTDSTRIYPYSTTVGAPSHIDLPATTVISVSPLVFYDAAYPGGNVVTSVAPSTPVYIRATVSDPFGSYDINGATITIKNPSNSTVVNAAAMTLSATGTETPSLTKIYQYGPYTPTTTGNWNISVTAAEGTEGTVSHTAYATLPVMAPMPLLSILKSASLANANPGQAIVYTVQIANSGAGAGSNVILRDDLSPYAAFNLNSYGAGIRFSFTDSAPASGLSLGTPAYSNDNGSTWTYVPVSGGGGVPAGFDGAITNWRIPMTGTIRSGGSFSLNYQVIVK